MATVRRHNTLRQRISRQHPSACILFMCMGSSVFLLLTVLSIVSLQRTPATGLGMSHHSKSSIQHGNMWESPLHILYGTAWKEGRTAELVEKAITAGFRFIDTACQPKHYNEPGVGAGWVAAAGRLGLQRSDLYLQTKFTPITGQDPNRLPYDPEAPLEDQVKQSLATSFKNLHTEYIDSLVLHSPLRDFEDTMKVWRVLESYVDEGKIKKLGISNCYDLRTFQALYNGSRHKPKVLQNRFYEESNFDTDLRAYCKDNGILYQSFWTLTANRRALASKEVIDLAASKGLSPQTLMYAFMMTKGHTPLSGTTNSQHMYEDVAVAERILGGEEILSDPEMSLMAAYLGLPGE